MFLLHVFTHKNLINEFLLTGWVSKRVKRHSLTHMCRSVTSGNIQISCPPETVRPLTLILCFRRSALTVGDGRVGEGEPGTDGGSGHPGGPAVVQRGRRGDTTGETEHTDEDMRVRGPLWLQRCAWEWCHRKRRQCSSCYRAGKKISHFQQWEETWCKSISGERARARSTQASKPLFRFGVISTSCGYRRDLTCIQNNLRADSMKRLRLRRWPVRVALWALRFLTPPWTRQLFVSRHRSFNRGGKTNSGCSLGLRFLSDPVFHEQSSKIKVADVGT